MVKNSINFKTVNLFIIIFLSFFISLKKVSASQTGTIRTNDGWGVFLRSSPAVSDNNHAGSIGENAMVNILNTNAGTGNGCNSNWYQISYSGKTGYVCSTWIITNSPVEIDPNGDFEKQMLAQGFTPSYLSGLKYLHQKFPNWVFHAKQTGLNFSSALDAESVPGISAIDGDDTSLRYVNDFGNYVTIEPGWYAASRSTVSYYLDPRNFLNEYYVFMFENLKYVSSYQNKAGVEKVLGDTYMPDRLSNYSDVFMQAATTYNVNPIHLASRVKQETGTSGSESTTGESFTFEYDQNCYRNLNNGYNTAWDLTNSCGNNSVYSGLYNFFNIGAYSSYKRPVYRGLIWANGGFDRSNTTYQRPWIKPETAILGGSEYISSQYINKNQNTVYFERFNVNPDAWAYNSAYKHQYMTNVRAHSSEASKTYTAYSKMNLLNSAFEFIIPVYNNMPNETALPTQPDTPGEQPNIPSVAVNTIVSGAGYRINSSYLSKISIGKSVNNITNDFKSISSAATVTIKDSSNNIKYGTIGTGDKVVVSNGSETKEYTAVIYGDTNGDGKITILDLLRVQKLLLNSASLSDAQYKAADNNQDGKVTVVDLLRVQKHILGSISIGQ